MPSPAGADLARRWCLRPDPLLPDAPAPSPMSDGRHRLLPAEPVVSSAQLRPSPFLSCVRARSVGGGPVMAPLVASRTCPLCLLSPVVAPVGLPCSCGHRIDRCPGSSILSEVWAPRSAVQRWRVSATATEVTVLPRLQTRFVSSPVLLPPSLDALGHGHRDMASPCPTIESTMKWLDAIDYVTYMDVYCSVKIDIVPLIRRYLSSSMPLFMLYIDVIHD